MNRKNLILAVSVSMLFVISGLSARVCTAQADNSAATAELMNLLQQHDDALGKKDLDGVMALWADGKKSVMMGTGPGERFEGKDEIRDAYTHIVADFDAGTASHSCYWKQGGVNGDMAWLAAMCKMSDSMKKKTRDYELNISAVFEKQDGKWLVRSMHYSNVVSKK